MKINNIKQKSHIYFLLLSMSIKIKNEKIAGKNQVKETQYKLLENETIQGESIIDK